MAGSGPADALASHMGKDRRGRRRGGIREDSAESWHGCFSGANGEGGRTPWLRAAERTGPSCCRVSDTVLSAETRWGFPYCYGLRKQVQTVSVTRPRDFNVLTHPAQLSRALAET